MNRPEPHDHEDEYKLTIEFEVHNEFGCNTFELDFTVLYDFSQGYAATGPSYSCGGEPGMPDEVNINDVNFSETFHLNGIFYAKGMPFNENCTLWECGLNIPNMEELEERIEQEIYENYISYEP